MADEASEFLGSTQERAFDLTASTVLITLLAGPALVGAGVHLVSEGLPIFYRDPRRGQGGQLFDMLKFRTMIRDAKQTEPKVCDVRDPRITKVGKVLRKFCIDEVPQLLHVMSGKMALVCPRPTNEAEEERFYDADPILCSDWQDVCLPHKTGLVGPGQEILKQARIHTAPVLRARMRADIEYIENASFALAIKSLVRTPLVTLRKRVDFSEVIDIAAIESAAELAEFSPNLLLSNSQEM